MFLRSEDSTTSGASADLATMWALSQRWYGDRLDDDYTPPSIEQLQQLLTDVGLTDDFWALQR